MRYGQNKPIDYFSKVWDQTMFFVSSGPQYPFYVSEHIYFENALNMQQTCPDAQCLEYLPTFG